MVTLACTDPDEYPDSPGSTLTLVGDPATMYGDASDATYTHLDFINTSNGTMRAYVDPLTIPESWVTAVTVHLRVEIVPNPGSEPLLSLELGGHVGETYILAVPGVTYGIGTYDVVFDHVANDFLVSRLIAGTTVRMTPFNVGVGGYFIVYELSVVVEALEPAIDGGPTEVRRRFVY